MTKEQNEQAKAPRNNWKIAGIIAGSIVSIALLFVIAYLSYLYMYQNKVFYGVHYGGSSVSGMSYEEVRELVASDQETLEAKGLTYTYDGDARTIYPSATNPLVAIRIDETAQSIYEVGRSGNDWQNFTAQVGSIFTQPNVDVQYTIDDEALELAILAEFSEMETQPVDAMLSFDDAGEPFFTEGENGKTFDLASAIEQTHTFIADRNTVSVILKLDETEPTVTTKEAEEQLSDIASVFDRLPVTFTYEDTEFTADEEDVKELLVFGDESLELDELATANFIAEIAGEIDNPPKEGRFSVIDKDGKLQLTQFEEGANGTLTDQVAAREQFADAVLSNGPTEITLIVEEAEPRATPDNLDDLGITELLGTGTTNFSGSPVNRRGNIQKGADLLNGLLIAPGETFSLVEALSPIDLAHGWLAELVIKGNKLEREAGGGLCQIGSTLFRATMMSGLDVIERRNHSWAISYYNYKGLAGVDATLYDPSPDYKFKNDTDNWVLIRSRIEGDDIYFDMYGTSDGRTGTFTDPINYNRVSPGPTEEVVDPSLPPGARNCVQNAYAGVSASFDYIIERPDGTTDSETFTSTYKPQAARCLVGPAAAEPTPEPAAETTETPSTDADSDTDATTDETTPAE